VKVCISIDLDDYQDYESLVDRQRDATPPSFYDDALPRFLDLFDRHGVRATFFVIGRDMANPSRRRRVRELVERGHEVGNHSFSHPYNFRALPRAQKAREIDRGDEAIADALGERPVGFRTPSCEISAETLHLLAERGYLYDSSVFPTPMMWLFMLYGRIFVRHANYQLGEFLTALAPPRPYFPSRDRLRRPRALDDVEAPRILEIPFSVLPGLRIPFYSTLLRRLGTGFFDLLLWAYGRRRPELHALFHQIELADLERTSLGRALERSPGLGVPFERRAVFVSHAVAGLAAAGEPVTLRELAGDHLAARASGAAA
jgi:hypothetical protein